MDPEGKTEAPASTTSLGNFTTVNSILRQTIVTSGTTNVNVYIIVHTLLTQRGYFIIHGNQGIHQRCSELNSLRWIPTIPPK